MKFSERQGLRTAKETVQLESMDKDLRNGLWNSFQLHYLERVNSQYIRTSRYDDFFRDLWLNFFKYPLDTLDNHYNNTRSEIREWFFGWHWFEVYDFIEYVASVECHTDEDDFIDTCNIILERELSAYRFIDGIISPITNEHEINEIDEAIQTAKDNNLRGVREHLETALLKMSDRTNPDYRNSIKESISAVEAIAKKISNGSKDSLGGALDKIRGKIKLHPSLEQGFKKIYGYTSDEGGIRHSMSDESNCDLEDAKYMLIASSAFVNYLITKSDKAGIQI
jgi:hypothetical protein